MFNERIHRLLKEISEAFADRRDPFNNEWLSKNDVSIDELHQLTGAVSSILDGFLWELPETQVLLLSVGMAASSFRG